jgi:hypothetical protein
MNECHFEQMRPSFRGEQTNGKMLTT